MVSYSDSSVGIQGQSLEVTVIGCSKLKDNNWISTQDPYVCLEYASTKFRTRTCEDGGTRPVFQEKFVFSLIEGLRELTVLVWSANTLSHDDLIGTGKIQLHKVLSEGFDDSEWPLQTNTGRYAGEVKLILHCANANRRKSESIDAPPVRYVTSYTPPPSAAAVAAPPYPSPYATSHSHAAPYPTSYSHTSSPYPTSQSHSAPYPTSYCHTHTHSHSSSPYPPPSSSYTAASCPYPPPSSSYAAASSPYPPPSSSSYAAASSPYPPSTYRPTSPYPSPQYPPGTYPPPPY